MKRFAVGYEFLCRIIMMIVVVNVAFVAHTLLGLIVGGLFPSVAASYATFRSWLLDVDDRSWTVKRTWSSLMVLLLFLITVWAYYMWPGLMMVFGVAVPIFATMMAVYSWGRLPGMDVHVLEPIGQDQNAGSAGTTTPARKDNRS